MSKMNIEERIIIILGLPVIVMAELIDEAGKIFKRMKWVAIKGFLDGCEARERREKLK